MATITLDRPEALNALTFEVYRELTEAFRKLREMPRGPCRGPHGHRPRLLHGR